SQRTCVHAADRGARRAAGGHCGAGAPRRPLGVDPPESRACPRGARARPPGRLREASDELRSYRPYMDEAQLVALARAGEETAVDELFGRVWPLAWHWAIGVTGDRMLADHLAQE